MKVFSLQLAYIFPVRHTSCSTNFIALFPENKFRTPLMAAMHEDDSPDLREVARILNNVLEVELVISLGS